MPNKYSARKNLICAIDISDFQDAHNIIKKIHDKVAAIKLGLEFFTKNGSDGVKKIVDMGVPVFLDLKFHDIPNTVFKAVKEATKLKVNMLTIHVSGGAEMIREAVKSSSIESKNNNIKPPMILGVTLLTSLSENDIDEIGYKNSINNQVMHMVDLSEKSGLSNFVCSAYEIKSIKEKYPQTKLVVPGIRFENDDVQDQTRVVTPAKALCLGADYVVMGRSILNSDPVRAINRFDLEVGNI